MLSAPLVCNMSFTMISPRQHRQDNKNGPAPMQCSRGTPCIEQPEILAIFGVMPLCSVSERKAQSAEQD